MDTPRPATPEVEAVEDDEEIKHQAALNIQKIIRGRAVQNLVRHFILIHALLKILIEKIAILF